MTGQDFLDWRRTVEDGDIDRALQTARELKLHFSGAPNAAAIDALIRAGGDPTPALGALVAALAPVLAAAVWARRCASLPQLDRTPDDLR